MKLYQLAAFATLLGSVLAKICVNVTVSVSVSARQAVFNLDIPQTSLEVTDFVLNLTIQGRNFSNVVLTGYDNTAGKYKISARYCKPSNHESANPTVQVLTHGIGFAKSYWDLPYNNYNYSYIDVATDQYKYSTLSYDRLGVGESSHGNPLNEIQAYLEVSALYQLTQMLRSGTLPGVKHTFKKVVHVGHSFGSAQTYSFANLYPEATDGIVLTGFSMNGSFLGVFPAGANFLLANQIQNLKNFPDGYLTFSDVEAIKFLQLKPKFFDNGILEYANKYKEAVSLGEILTLGDLVPLNKYAGPVLVITGDSDLDYCGGNCLATGDPNLPSIPAAMIKNFPNVPAGDFVAYIQPDMSHGINLHYNATGAYKVVQNFLDSKGLRST